jgi:streptogramin lyase
MKLIFPLAALLFFVSCSKKIDNTTISVSDVFPTTAGGGDTVTVYGKNFPLQISSEKITINNKPVEVVSTSSDSIKFVVPKKIGSGKLLVSIGTDSFEAAEFTYKYRAVVSTVAGTGAVGRADGQGSQAEFNEPWGITTDGNGNLYVADSYNRLIRKINVAEKMVSTINIPTTVGNAEFYSPYNLDFDEKTKDLYVTDFNEHILKISASGEQSVIYQGAMPIAGIAVGPDDKVYFTNNVTGQIWRMDKDGANAEWFVTDLHTPRNIVFDNKGFMYVLSYLSINQIGPDAKPVIVAVDGDFGGWEFARDTSGNFYEADYSHNVIKKIDTRGKISTIAGSGVASDADGVDLNASFDHPVGITIDEEGNLYVTTYNFTTGTGNKVRKITFE